MIKVNKFPKMAMLAGLAMAVFTSSSRADFEVQFSYGGATITVDVTMQTTSVSGGASLSGASITYTGSNKVSIHNLTISNAGTTGGFVIDASVSTTNTPGTPNAATISTSGLGI